MDGSRSSLRSRIENFDPRVLWEVAESVPPEWYGSNLTEMEHLIEQLISRGKKVRDLVDPFRESTREPELEAAT